APLDGRLVHDAVELSAMDAVLGVRIARELAARLLVDELAVAVEERALLVLDRDRLDPRLEAERRELARRMGKERDSDAQLLHLGHRLVHAALEPPLAHREREGEPRDPASDHDRLHRSSKPAMLRDFGVEKQARPALCCEARATEGPMKSMATMVAAAVFGIAALAPAARAADEPYPNRPVKLIVPYTPGTGIDILARTLGQKLSEEWKVPVVVENRPGASGAIGTEAVAKSAPDGYTILMQASSIVIDPSMHKKSSYDPVKDFEPVAPLAIGNMGLVVNPSVKAETVKELVALAKASPGRLTYASPGSGTPHHLAMELFKARTGIDVLHVPY